uniref:Uncharacterized protein n=1 Tax=Heterorhabditis bacteriophora TaxID=37862 RepID=A0A1I7X0S1_HETBA
MVPFVKVIFDFGYLCLWKMNKRCRVKQYFQEIRMNLRDFIYNDKTFNERIPERERVRKGEMKLVGMKYNSETDICAQIFNEMERKSCSSSLNKRCISHRLGELATLIKLIHSEQLLYFICTVLIYSSINLREFDLSSFSILFLSSLLLHTIHLYNYFPSRLSFVTAYNLRQKLHCISRNVNTAESCSITPK